MNISKILLTGAFIGMSLASCTNENDYLKGTDRGTMSLGVEKLMPKPKNAATETRAVETEDFPVTIYSLTDNKEFVSYDKATLVPNRLTMPVGQYYATAHTPGNLEKIMAAPYYFGREEFEIMKAVNTEATVTCRMANGSFTVRFSADFAQVFSSWTVSIDDGSALAIIYTSDLDGLNPATKYMRFEENVASLKVNFVGTTVTGNRIVTNNILTKKNASEIYDSDNEFFSGGDAIVIHFSPVESTEGDITGITLKANISFEETEENFDMEVEDADNGGTTPDNPDNPDNPNAITLNLPANMTVDMFTDPSLGDTYIASENGLKSIQVKMASTSEDMISSLADLKTNYGVDFVEGTEVVDNDVLVRLFSDLGQTLSVPAEGDKEYVFPIGNFFILLSVLPGDHTFDLVVTDMDGNTKSGRVVLTVE
ncbi:MAG: DUF4493 domain-containing protein [Bacteroides sp.]|nr:DUF4493 domain-containing protein [Bacteroides sp.]MCM1447492.1 DUF4493 domain-containing protein [Bacteroides sp.]